MVDLFDELASKQEQVTNQLICEGVDDPGILKVVFMAGGPGSGKTFTANDIFGIDSKLKSSFAATGLKVVNSDKAFESALKKHGIDPTDLAKIEKEDAELWDKITKYPDGIRNKAKMLTKKQQSFYEVGRLGMIIDGTGSVYSKISKMKIHAEKLGYDTFMLFIDTTLEVAQERNKNRDDRVLPADLVAQTWTDVQTNKSKFKSLFGGNFALLNNTVYKNIKWDDALRKGTRTFVTSPVRNQIGKDWIAQARALKNANLIK